MSRYLLDTNAFSYAVRHAFVHFGRRFDAVNLDDVAISVITEAELLFGLARRPQAHALATSVQSLLMRIAILPWNSECARNYASIRAELERRGQPMSVMNMMIAAHALAEDAVLVTNDEAFRQIAHLKTEDWTA